LSYLCTRFDKETTFEKAGVHKRSFFEKFFQKYLEVKKTCLTFAPLSAPKKRVVKNEKS